MNCTFVYVHRNTQPSDLGYCQLVTQATAARANKRCDTYSSLFTFSTNTVCQCGN
jgi:hypothetical protein